MIAQLLSLLILLLSLAVGAIFFIDPNQYKATLQTALSKQIGREIQINGDLNWQLGTGLSIEANDIVVKNPDAQIKSLSTRIQLFSLLRQEIIIDKVVLTQGNIYLSKNTPKLTPTESGDSKPLNLKIKHLAIKDTMIHWQDITLENFNLTADNIKTDTLFPITVNTQIKTPELNSRIHFKGQTDLHKILGQFTARAIKAGEFNIEQLKGNLNHQDNILALSELEGRLYGGTMTGNLTVNHQTLMPKHQLIAKFNGLAIKAKNLLGEVDLNLHLASQGADPTTIKSHLTGKFDFNMGQGFLNGIDIPYVMNVAMALINKINFTQKPKNGTAFGQLSASGVINHGVIDNNKLLLTSNTHRVTGRGKIDLSNDAVKYRILIQDPKADTAGLLGKLQEILGGSIPVIIRGDFNNLRYEPDMAEITRARAKLLIKAPLDILIKDPVKGIKNRLNAQ